MLKVSANRGTIRRVGQVCQARRIRSEPVGHRESQLVARHGRCGPHFCLGLRACLYHCPSKNEVTMTGQLLKDFVKYTLQNPENHKWSLQGFGMFRVYLSPEVRLHL